MSGSPDGRDRRVAALWGLLALGLYAPGLLLGPPGAKGITGAYAILEGDVPYRDFWTMYAPGQFYAQALLFTVFGRAILVQAVAAILVKAASCAFFFLLLRRLGVARRLALLLSFPFWALGFAVAPELTSYPPLVLLALLGFTRIVAYVDGGRAPGLFGAGVLFGAGALFKHDVAAYLTAASALALTLSFLLVSERPPGWVHPARVALLLGAGAAVVVVPAALLIGVSAGADAWRDLIEFPAVTFRGVRGEAYPALGPALRAVADALERPDSHAALHHGAAGLMVFLLAHLPEAVFLIAAPVVYFRRWTIAPARLAAALLFLGTMPFFWLAAHVQQNTHLVSMAALSLLLIGMAFEGLRGAGRPWIRRLLAAGTVVYAGAILIVPLMGVGRLALEWPRGRAVELPGCAGFRLPLRVHETHDPIARFIAEHVPPDERIYVGIRRHDVPVVTDLRFFALTRRRSCTRYTELHPGVTDRADVQREIVDSIRAHDVRCAVIWNFGWSDDVLDEILLRRRAAVPELGSTLLDDFMAREFEEIGRFGEYSLRWRRGVPRPPGW